MTEIERLAEIQRLDATVERQARTIERLTREVAELQRGRHHLDELAALEQEHERRMRLVENLRERLALALSDRGAAQDRVDRAQQQVRLAEVAATEQAERVLERRRMIGS